MRAVKKIFTELHEIGHNIKFLLKPTWKYGKGYFMSMIILRGIVIYPLITLIQISSIRLIINAFIENKSFGEIIAIPLVLEGALLILGLLDSAYTEYYVNKKSLDISNNVSKELYNKVLRTDYINFDDPDFYNNYSYTARFYTANVTEAFTWLIDLIQAIVTITSLFVMASASDPFVLCAIFIAIILSTVISKKLNRLNEEKQNKHIPHNRTMFYVDKLFALKEIAAEQKCTGLPKFAFELYDNAINEKKKLIDKYKGKALRYRGAGGFSELLFNLSINIYLIYRVSARKILFGDFAGLLAAANALRRNVGIFFNSYTKAHDFNVHCRQIHKFFDKKSVIEDNTGKENIPDGAFEVDFRDVCFSYNNSDFAIKNFRLKINKGEKIAFVGENGAGKTTITKLLTRLYDPSSGDILINGKSLKEYNTKQLRMKIGMAFQNTHLYTMTYDKNLSLYHDMNEHELDEVSRLLKLDKVLAKNNAGYYSQVGREFNGSGIVMSGGEIQKVGIARILLGDFGLLVLDEPTASLDPLAEYELNKIIFDKAKTTTTVLISHRLSNVRDADRIIFIENGCIAEEGSHDELMLKCGKYYEMFSKQAKNYRG